MAMAKESLIATDIEAYLAVHEHKRHAPIHHLRERR